MLCSVKKKQTSSSPKKLLTIECLDLFELMGRESKLLSSINVNSAQTEKKWDRTTTLACSNKKYNLIMVSKCSKLRLIANCFRKLEYYTCNCDTFTSFSIFQGKKHDM